jgi:hypothetical protein
MLFSRDASSSTHSNVCTYQETLRLPNTMQEKTESLHAPHVSCHSAKQDQRRVRSNDKVPLEPARRKLKESYLVFERKRRSIQPGGAQSIGRKPSNETKDKKQLEKGGCKVVIEPTCTSYNQLKLFGYDFERKELNRDIRISSTTSKIGKNELDLLIYGEKISTT